jgi:methionine synthase I (cobalamin-dependent)
LQAKGETDFLRWWQDLTASSPQMVEVKPKYTAGPEEFAAHVESWIEAGARIVSACGSGPPHVEGMVKKLKDLRPEEAE